MGTDELGRDKKERGDLIEMFKEINGLEKINWYTGPAFPPDSQTPDSRPGNRLTNSQVNVISVNSFKVKVVPRIGPIGRKSL